MLGEVLLVSAGALLAYALALWALSLLLRDVSIPPRKAGHALALVALYAEHPSTLALQLILPQRLFEALADGNRLFQTDAGQVGVGPARQCADERHAFAARRRSIEVD